MTRLLAVALAAFALTPAAALAAEPSVDVVPPAMAGRFHRTADPQPVFGVEAHGVHAGDRLECYGDSGAGGDSPCGPPLPGCTAELCGSYQPDTPLTDGEHDFTVELVDPDGRSELSHPAGLLFIVDTTLPPRPDLGGPFDPNPLRPAPFRPHFSYTLGLDTPAYSVSDHAQCSLTVLGRPAHWRACPADGAAGYAPRRIAHRGRDYRFQVRAVDDLGRAGRPAVADFNPIPCSARARHTSLRRLLAHGLSVRVRCSLARAAIVVLDDRRLGVLRVAVVHGRRGRRHWTRRRAVRVDPLAVPYVKARHRLRLAVTVVGGDDPDAPAYGQPRTARLSVRG